MSELLIVFALLAVGKIHGQEAVVLQITNLRPLHVPAFDRRPVPYQEREYSDHGTSQPPPRLYTNPPRSDDRDLPQKPNGSGNLNLLALTVNENQLKRKLFVSSKIPEKMNQPLNVSEYSDPVNYTEYLSNDVYEDIRFENNRTPGYVVKPAVKKTTVNVKSENVTTSKPAFVNTNMSNNGSVPGITFDERSSFSGDPCPAGFARVNEKCVKADQ